MDNAQSSLYNSFSNSKQQHARRADASYRAMLTNLHKLLGLKIFTFIVVAFADKPFGSLQLHVKSSVIVTCHYISLFKDSK